ncbi:MAG: biopolymer transporter [Cyanobacteria bacterium P01_F01_bin.33]
MTTCNQLRVGWTRSLLHLSGVAIVSLMAIGCSRTPFQTPRPNLSNDGLNSLFPDRDPSVSANGRFIAFSSVREGSENVYLYDHERQRLIDLRGLNSDELAASDPDISADARYIVYLSTFNGKSDVFFFDRQSEQRPENISRSIAGDVRNPSISPDGRYITFESNSAGQWDIEIYDRGAERPTPETTPQARSTPSP